MLCRLKLPVAYHSRSSSVVISGTDVPRPRSFPRYTLVPVLQSPGTKLYIKFMQALSLEWPSKLDAKVRLYSLIHFSGHRLMKCFGDSDLIVSEEVKRKQMTLCN